MKNLSLVVIALLGYTASAYKLNFDGSHPRGVRFLTETFEDPTDFHYDSRVTDSD